jgi:16S rRNA (guanine527-N7)-methyltransferase
VKSQRFEPEREVFAQTLVELAPSFELSLNEGVVDLLTQHYELLLKWNQSMNLTTVVNPKDAARFHYLESLYAGKFIRLRAGCLIDVGSGAGFPGIPLAIGENHLNFVLIESNTRKSVFLNQAVKHLELENVEIFCGRFQDYPHHDFQVILCRAMDRFDETIAEVLDFGKACMQIIFFVGKELVEKIEFMSTPDWEVEHQQIPLSEGRFLALLSSKRAT